MNNVIRIKHKGSPCVGCYYHKQGASETCTHPTYEPVSRRGKFDAGTIFERIGCSDDALDNDYIFIKSLKKTLKNL